MEQFDSRWLGTGEYDPSMAPEGLENYPRAAGMYSRGRSPSVPYSSPCTAFCPVTPFILQHQRGMVVYTMAVRLDGGVRPLLW